MNTDNIRNTLSVLGKTFKNAKSGIDKLEARQLYIIFLKRLIKSEHNSLKYYEDMIRNDGFDSESIREIIFNIQSEIKIDIEKKHEEEYDYILSDDKDIINQNKLLIEKLIEDFKNPNELLIETWLNNYSNFIEMYKNKFDLEKMSVYIKSLFKQYDKDSKYKELINKFFEDVLKSQDTKDLKDLSIVNIKRSYNDILKEKIKRIAMSKILKENGIHMDGKKDTLLDNNYIPYTKESLSKKMRSDLKIKLISEKEYDKEDKSISSDYQKNRYIEMLLNGGASKKINKKFDNLYKNEKSDYQDSLVKKGLGNV